MIQKFKFIYDQFIFKINTLKSLPLLAIRLVLAYGFYGPAKAKWEDIGAVGEWFAGMGIPLPYLNAYMAAGTESIGVVLLTLGLFTRIISIPLTITMIVAIVTVHGANGFEAGNNGFEIPLYYILMLMVLFFNGAGKVSLDYVLFWKKKS